MKEKKPFRYWKNHIEEIYEEARKYDNVLDFKKHSQSAYTASMRFCIYKKVCKHMLRKGEIGLSIKEIKKEAKKYRSITEFQKKAPKIFCYIRVHFLIDDVCSHMDLSRRKKRIKPLLKEKEIRKIAKKYKRRCDFNTYASKASKDAKKLNIYEDVCSHMNKVKLVYNPITKKKEETKPTLSEVLKVSKKYKTREELKEKNRGLYEYCCRNNIFKEACAHMPINASVKHSFESIFNNAKKCKTITEFNLKYPNDYKSAKKRGFLDKIKQKLDFEFRDHSISIGEKTALHYINRLLKINLKPIKNVKWLKYKNHYLTLDGYDEANKIAFEYNGHLHLKSKIRKKDNFKKKRCQQLGIKLIIIKEYKDIKRSQLIETLPPAVKKECIRLNLKIKNHNTRVIIQTNSNKLNIKKLKKLISRYKTIKMFAKNQGKAYRFICYNKLTYLMKKLKKHQRN